MATSGSSHHHPHPASQLHPHPNSQQQHHSIPPSNANAHPQPSQFPWTVLKAECLRLVVSQLLDSLPGEFSGMNSKARYGMNKKEEMIEFLGEVERGGVQHAFQKLSHSQNSNMTTTTNGNATASGSSPSKTNTGGVKSNKRKSPEPSVSEGEGDEDAEGETDADEEGYNTRFKGVKRVRVGEAPHGKEDGEEGGSGTATVNQDGGATTTTATAAGQTPQKKRGRPRKNPVDGPPKPRGRPRKSVGEANEGGEAATAPPSPKKRGRPRKSEEVKEKRPRGRPRKSASTAVVAGGDGAAGASGSGGQGEGGAKQVFDGVVLKARGVITASNGQDDVGEGDVDAEGEEDEGDVSMNILTEEGVINDLSSLGDSNKENEPTVGTMVYTPDESEPLAAVENNNSD
ncbi:hypothetical protein BJ165DRAFT_1407423 [Panaeolus papilionaceus]|nr:hypothetical protein BJ165DRAFT_1407423 [Panaeolus papilionaceus]